MDKGRAVHSPTGLPISLIDLSWVCMRQFQAPSPSEIDEAGHERHETVSSAEIKIGDASVWRFSQVSLPLHPVLHHQQPRWWCLRMEIR